MQLYDEGLRSPQDYGVAIFWAAAIAKLLASIRLGCTAVLIILFVSGVPRGWQWLWLATVAVAVVGSCLAWLGPREDVLYRMKASHFWPFAWVGRYELYVARRASVSVPGVLEAIGPLLTAVAIASPTGLVAGRPGAFIAASATITLYAATAWFQLMADGSYYLPGSRGVPRWVARWARRTGPMLAATLYAVVLSLGASGATAVVPWITAVFLLLIYPAVFMFDDMLRSARLHREDMISNELRLAACTVHAYLSTPVHFIEMEARHGTAERVVGQLQDLRARVRQCRTELVEGAPPGRIDDLVADIAAVMPSDQRHRLRLDDSSDVSELGRVDFAMARRVFADLCGNALKASGDGRLGTNVNVRAQWRTAEEGRFIDVLVRDDGPGINSDIPAGTSLELLRLTLELAHGDMKIQPRATGGTDVKAYWLTQPKEDEQ